MHIVKMEFLIKNKNLFYTIYKALECECIDLEKMIDFVGYAPEHHCNEDSENIFEI